MANITLSVPEELRRRIKKHREVRWSEVIRGAIIEYLNKLEGGSRETEELLTIVERDGIDLSTVTVEEAVRYYRKMRHLEWQRSSTIQVS